VDVTPEHKIRMTDGTYVPAEDVGKSKWGILAWGPCIAEWANVERIQELPRAVDVFDLQVEEFSNFIANGICVHNSDAPNFQNMPARNERLAEIVRRCFIARGADRHFVEIDFASSEVKCLSADTKIATIDGDQPIAQVVRRIQKNEKVHVYSWDAEKNCTAIHQAVNGWKTGIQRDVWAVEFDNGEVVKATENHLFMLRDGTYRRLDELRAGDSLMQFHCRLGSSPVSDRRRKGHQSNCMRRHSLLSSEYCRWYRQQEW